MRRASSDTLRDSLLAAAEKVVARQGIANLTLEAVAAEAGVSKGGLLHHFPSKDRLVEGLVARAAECWRSCCRQAYDSAPAGRGRMARGLIQSCMTDAESWTDQLRASSAAVFAALAQNPALIAPMREAYGDLRLRLAEDDLPPGVGEAIAAAIDGLWLYWVLGLVPVDQALMVRMRAALEAMLTHAEASSPVKPIRRKPVKRKTDVVTGGAGGRGKAQRGVGGRK